MVRGKKYWIVDKECKVLMSYHETRDEARRALKDLERFERKEGYFIPRYYGIINNMLGALRIQGYTVLDEI